MSDTPETDAEAMDGIDCYGEPLKSWDYKSHKDGEVVPAEFSRKLERERDEARRERDELREKLSDSDVVMKWSASKVEELNKGITRLITERNQAREIARIAFYIIRGVDPKFVKLAYERSVYWNGQDQPIQFMRDAIKAWDKEKKEEA